eukprot:TRINITY_DN4784_c0_g6_i1.p1 TRINITY_DN4784_c0_g6~~TRINITY_DN4784_c0_g6_i1.p1  ORF type:complete len:329 (-),score=72.95 TRINITY_DN4784_c0_g6_i1:229-1185(-)
MAGCVEQQTFDEQDWTGVRVMTMQNLPCRCSPEELKSVVREFGFWPYVNYFHLPQRSPGGRNCGYGFIGFVTPELALKFRDVFEGFNLKSRASFKQVRLTPAHRQLVPAPNWPQPDVLAHQQQPSLPSVPQENMTAYQQQASVRNRSQVTKPAHQQQAFSPNRPLADAPEYQQQQQSHLPNWLHAKTPAHQQQAFWPHRLQPETPARQQQASWANRLHANALAHQRQAFLPDKQQASMSNLRHATVSSSQHEEVDLGFVALQQEAVPWKVKIDLMVAALKREWPMQTCCSWQLASSDCLLPQCLEKEFGGVSLKCLSL